MTGSREVRSVTGCERGQCSRARVAGTPLTGWLAVKRAAPPGRNRRKPGTKPVASETRCSSLKIQCGGLQTSTRRACRTVRWRLSKGSPSGLGGLALETRMTLRRDCPWERNKLECETGAGSSRANPGRVSAKMHWRERVSRQDGWTTEGVWSEKGSSSNTGRETSASGEAGRA